MGFMEEISSYGTAVDSSLICDSSTRVHTAVLPHRQQYQGEGGSSCSNMVISVLCPAVQCVRQEKECSSRLERKDFSCTFSTPSCSLLHSTVCEAREGKQQQQIGKEEFQLHFFHALLQLAGHEKFSAVCGGT